MNRSTYRVIYGDTDQMGVVYYANYLTFFERGRCEVMREHRFDYGALERDGFFLPVVEAHVKYRAPARFDDLVTIEAGIVDASRTTITFAYRVLRAAEGAGSTEMTLCEGTTVHACTNRAGRPVRLPDALRALVPEHLLSPRGLEAKRDISLD